MNGKKGKLNISGVAVTVLFAVFAVSILSLLVSGADVYGRITAADDAAYSSRTASQYLLTKLQSVASADAVTTDTFGDSDAVIISEEIEGETYLTRIYCYQGWLRELWSGRDDQLPPSSGEKIMEMKSLSLERQGRLLRLRLENTDGQTEDLSFCLRGGEAEQ